MKGKYFLKGVIEVILQLFSLIGIDLFILYQGIADFSLRRYMLVSIMISVFLVFISFILIRSEANNKVISCYFLCNIVCLPINVLIATLMHITIFIDQFSLRETNNADGIVIIFVFCSFVLSFLLLKLILWFILFIKNLLKDKDINEK